MKKTLSFFLVLICSVATAQEYSIKLEPDPVQLHVGESVQLTATVVDANGNEVQGREFIYSTNTRARRLTLDESTGMVTGERPGEFKIIVISPGETGPLRGEFPIRVAPAPIARVEVGEVPETFYTMTTFHLPIEVYDAAGIKRNDVSVQVASSNESVAVVDPFHQIHALKSGKATITANVEGIEGAVSFTVTNNPVTNVELTADISEARTGDVINLQAVARDKSGKVVSNAPITYSYQGRSFDVSKSPSAMVSDEGKFVANEAGFYTIIASCGTAAASLSINCTPRDVTRKIEMVGQGSVQDQHTSDFWIWEGVDGRDYAVTGTWGANGKAYFWDVTNPGSIKKIDSVQVDARTVNDVKISEDGRICVISREGASNRKNGIVIIDVTNPADVSIISTFTENLTGGVHNLFIYQDHVYALSAGRKYYVVSIKDPKNPKIVGDFEIETPGRSIHDVWIEDGIAYSSNWRDGVQLVDVGNGIAGGSPENPVPFANYAYPSGWNHAAFPYRDKKTGKFYVIAGDEAFPYGLDPEGKRPEIAAGYLHVIDFTDLENPKEVAWFEVPFAGSHNFWIEDDILYAAFYNAGVRVVDLSGELMGDLGKQGREIAWIIPFDPDGYRKNAPFTWGAQPYKGHIFYSDWNSGLWAAKLEPVVPEDTQIQTR